MCHSRLAEVEGQLCGVGSFMPLLGFRGGWNSKCLHLPKKTVRLQRIIVGSRHVCGGEKTGRNGLLIPPCVQMSDKGFQPYLVSGKGKCQR